MNTTLDLKGTEKASFKLAAYSDGIADIGLGLVVITLAIYPFTRELLGVNWNALLYLASVGLIIFLQTYVKNRLAPSRIGIVDFGKKANKRLRAFGLITAVLVVLTVLTWYLSTQGYFLPTAFPGSASWMGTYGFDILLAVVVLLIFSAMAYTLDLTRFYFYGLILGLSFPLQNLLPAYPRFPVLTAGIVIVAVGIVLLTRFLKDFPAVGTDIAEEV
ncbi:MAG: hypothetical protein KAU23_03245 [Anaerolineales bacterium]|nr:hypothetical protein [Anaerolineales bacterium]